MAEDMFFSANDAVISNLDRLAKEHCVINEQRLLELYDVAAPMADATGELCSEGLSVSETLSALSELLTLGDYPVSEHNTPERFSFVKKSIAALKYSDRAVLTELYTGELARRSVPISEGDFFPFVAMPETFTYVRNSFSDEAYDVFSQDFSDPKVRYSASFRECARAVSEGEVTYCLLPLEEKGGARLPTVSEIIFRNDFKINSVIPVFGPDGNADMKYALVSKNFTVPKRDADDDGYLEIRLDASSDNVLTEVFSAVDYFGMSVYRVNTVTFDTEGESETYFSVVIRDSGNNFAGLLTYFTLFIGDFVPVGIYKNLE